MPEQTIHTQFSWRHFWRVVGIGFGALFAILLLLAVLLALDANALRKPIAKTLSAALHREIQIGDLYINLFRAEPQITVGDLHIGNPAPFPAEMGSVKKIAVQFQWLPLFGGNLVLPMVNIEQPNFLLLRTADKNANWVFSQNGGDSGGGGKLPVIQHLILNGGSIGLNDAVQKLQLNTTIETTDAGSNSGAPFEIKGDGTFNNKPFKVDFSGPSLLNLDVKTPYHFNVVINLDQTAVHADGVLPKPFDMTDFETQLDLKGNDLADLYYITGLAFPNTPPYHIKGELTGAKNLFHFSNFNGNLGSSDLLGDIQVQTGQKKPKIIANLKSKLLDFKDLGALFGAQVSGVSGGATPVASTAPVHLLPDAPLQVERVRAMDAEVHYRADAVNAPGLPLRQVSLDFYLENSVLQFKPFSFTLPQGKLEGTAQVDARPDVPIVDMDVRLSHAHLEDFAQPKSAKKSGQKSGPPPIEGEIMARVKLHGVGDSVHRAASTANGEITVVVPHGSIRRAFAELLGIDVVEGMGLLLSGDEQQTELRCGVVDLKAQNGILTPQVMVFDTGVVVTRGSGNINLNSEAMDMELQGEPKEARLVRVMAPITIGGTLARPAIGVDPKKTAAQAGAATALSVFLTPLAAVLPFINLDLAKDANCQALLSQAKVKN